jgi:hypothetical protein
MQEPRRNGARGYTTRQLFFYLPYRFSEEKQIDTVRVSTITVDNAEDRDPGQPCRVLETLLANSVTHARPQPTQTLTTDQIGRPCR